MVATLQSCEIHLYNVNKNDYMVRDFGYCVMLEFESGTHTVNVALSPSVARGLVSDLHKELDGKEDVLDGEMAELKDKFNAVEGDRDLWKIKYENMATSAICYVDELQTLKSRLDAVETDRNCWKKKYKDWEKVAMIPIPIGCKKRLNAIEAAAVEKDRDYWMKKCKDMETNAGHYAGKLVELKERIVAAEKKRDELKDVKDAVDKLNKVEDIICPEHMWED